MVGLGKRGRTGENWQGEQKIEIEMNTKMSNEIWAAFRKGQKKMG